MDWEAAALAQMARAVTAEARVANAQADAEKLRRERDVWWRSATRSKEEIERLREELEQHGKRDQINCGVLRERAHGAERREREAIAEAYRHRMLFQAAASLIAYNRTRLAKPRGADEARVLEYLDQYGSVGLGPFWSGKTDGWVQPSFFDALSEGSGRTLTSVALEIIDRCAIDDQWEDAEGVSLSEMVRLLAHLREAAPGTAASTAPTRHPSVEEARCEFFRPDKNSSFVN